MCRFAQPKNTSKGPTLQELAHAAQLSGVEADDISWMAKLGSYGEQPGNISRDLMAKMCKGKDLVTPEPYVTKVPMLVKSKDTEIVEMSDNSFFLPTDWVASIAKSGDEALKDMVFNFRQVSTFWKDHRADDPKLHDNPVTRVTDYKNKMCPMLLHGDGGQFQRRDSLDVISLHSVLSKASATFKFLLLTAVPKRCVAKDPTNPAMDTMLAVWEVLVWNLNCAFRGVHPETDHTGKPWPEGSYRAKLAGKTLCEGYGLWVFGVNPDLEHLQNQLKLRCHSFHDCCWMCPANKSDIPFTDCSPFALWRQRRYSAEENRSKPATKHPVMRILGVVNESFCIESLHTNELGVALHFIGNVLWDQVYKKYTTGANVHLRVAKLWEWVMKTYTELGVKSSDRISKLTLKMITDPSRPHQVYPELSKVKAKHAKCLVPVVVRLREKTFESHPSPCLAHCCKAGKGLVTMYEIMDSAGMHPSPEDRINFREAVDTFQLSYAALSADHQRKNLKQWNTVTKFHYSAHSPDFFDFFNIKYTTAYGGETEVGLICALGHRCLDGTPAHKIHKKLAEKYRLGQHIRLTGNFSHDTDVDKHFEMD